MNIVLDQAMQDDDLWLLEIKIKEPQCKPMTFFVVLLIVLLAARIFAELAARLKAPSVIGELLAGAVLGPSLLGWVEPIEAIKLMAEIGIILLLFEVGLETDPKQLARAGPKSLA